MSVATAPTPQASEPSRLAALRDRVNQWPGRRWLHERFIGHPGWVITGRWLLLLVATAIAFWRTLNAVGEEMGAQTAIGYVPVVMVLTVIAVIGIAVRRGDEPPIYDRQTDVIAGLIVLFLALACQVMVNPRYAQAYLTTHMDLLAMWLFMLGTAILLFGLRPVARYRWAWLVLLTIWPVPLRIVVLTLRLGSLGAGIVTVMIAALATAIAVGRTRRRAFFGAAAATVLGLSILALCYLVLGTRAPLMLIMPAPLLCAAVVGVVMYIEYRNRADRSWGPMGRPFLPPTLARIGRPIFVIAACTAILAFVPVPAVGTWPSAVIPGMRMGVPLAVPDGWTETDIKRDTWVQRIYGEGAVLYRQMLTQRVGSIDYDKQERPRVVAVDSITVPRPLSLEVYSYIFRYNLVGNRFGAALEIDLPHGVRSWIWNVVDDRRYLTYTVMSWWWTDGDQTQQVILWAVDDHQANALFPEPRITIAQNLNTMMTVMFRGNASIQDETPSYKDKPLLSLLGAELVDAQVARAGSTP